MIQSERLTIRTFKISDTADVHRSLSLAFGADPNQVDSFQKRASWVQWSILNQEWFPALKQPPYGERAICRKNDNRLIGVIGLVPCLDRFDKIPELVCQTQNSGFTQSEVGLFWAIHPDYQKMGYASEAANTFLGYIWQELKVWRVIATTESENKASIAVMEKIGMQILNNPQTEPPWLQIVGVIYHPDR